YPNTKNLHGHGFAEGRVGIFGAGTANVGPYQIGDKNIFKMLTKGHELVKDSEKKIMVTHMPHSGGKAEVFGFPGSPAVRDAVESFEPDVLISSHIHEAGGIEEKIGKTIIFNVSKKERVFEI
ncbi:MAG: hypothetical protein Q8P81_01840, partial [Nanoarchaeota archaeon]|nr:hypothetical protein [Nanoarchaeota archaeon]